jgi:hypothetical protein
VTGLPSRDDPGQAADPAILRQRLQQDAVDDLPAPKRRHDAEGVHEARDNSGAAQRLDPLSAKWVKQVQIPSDRVRDEVAKRGRGTADPAAE